jgi:LysM repeat protein
MFSDNQHLHRMRQLSIGLILSGALNVMFLSLFFYFSVKEMPPVPFELKPAGKREQQAPLAIDRSNSEVIRYLKKLPMEQLMAKLSHTKMVDNGFSERDLSLAVLVSFHHFNLDQALLGSSPPDQERVIVYGKYQDGTKAEITIFPGFSDQQFQKIISFAHTEKWPLTTEGLFKNLQKNDDPNDTSLYDAFFLTPEFLAVEILFNRSDVNVGKMDLLKVLLEGDWSMISNFMDQQRIAQDLSPARRQRFLLDYIDYKSHAAAYLILKTDGEFAFRKLDDHHILSILDLLDVSNTEAQKFSLALLTSPRSNNVRNKAKEKLYAFKGDSSVQKPIMPTKLTARIAPENAIQLKHDNKDEKVEKHELSKMPALMSSTESPTVPVASKEEKSISPVMNPSKISPPKDAKLVVQSTPATKIATISKKISYSDKKKIRAYIVQEGDSLWKVSQRFKVNVEEIRKLNKLESDRLKPGTLLNIPS